MGRRLNPAVSSSTRPASVTVLVACFLVGVTAVGIHTAAMGKGHRGQQQSRCCHGETDAE